MLQKWCSQFFMTFWYKTFASGIIRNWMEGSVYTIPSLFDFPENLLESRGCHLAGEVRWHLLLLALVVFEMASRSRSWVSSKCLTKQPGHCSEAAMEHFINTDLSSSSVRGAVKGGFMNTTRAALKSCPLACWQGSASFRCFGMFQNSCRTVLMPWQVISILTFACIDLFVWLRFSLTI